MQAYLSHASEAALRLWDRSGPRIETKVAAADELRRRPHTSRVIRLPPDASDREAKRAGKQVQTRGNTIHAKTDSAAILFPAMRMSTKDAIAFATEVLGEAPDLCRLFPDIDGIGPLVGSPLSYLVSRACYSGTDRNQFLSHEGEGLTYIGEGRDLLSLSIDSERADLFARLMGTDQKGSPGNLCFRYSGYFDPGRSIQELQSSGRPKSRENLPAISLAPSEMITTRRNGQSLMVGGNPDVEVTGYVYIAGTAGGGDGPWKVGFTRKDPIQRVNTGAMTRSFLGEPSELILAVAVSGNVEKRIEHMTQVMLASHALNPQDKSAREWFATSLDNVVEVLRFCCSDISPEWKIFASMDDNGVALPITRKDWHDKENMLRLSLQNAQHAGALIPPHPSLINILEDFWDVLNEHEMFADESPSVNETCRALDWLNSVSGGSLLPDFRSIVPQVMEVPQMTSSCSHGQLEVRLSMSGHVGLVQVELEDLKSALSLETEESEACPEPNF